MIGILSGLAVPVFFKLANFETYQLNWHFVWSSILVLPGPAMLVFLIGSSLDSLAKLAFCLVQLCYFFNWLILGLFS